MKKIPHFLSVFLFLFILASTAAAAGIQPNSFTLSGIVGGYTFDGKQDLETKPVVGIRGGYNFTKHFGVEALFDFVSTEGSQSGINDVGDAKVYRYGGDLLLHFFPDNKLVPYLAAGYGGITVDYDDQQNMTRGIFDYGPGVKYFMTDNLALRGDFRQLIFRDNETLFNYEYTVGLTYQFGGTKPAPIVAPVPAVVETPPEAPLEPMPVAEPTPEIMKYCVYLNIMFEIDKAYIRPEYGDEVAKVGDFMKKNPTTTAVIEGYTDEVGSDDYNLKLSQQRAESVVNALVADFGIDRSRLSAKGYGKSQPIADNATDEGRQKNRRINAIIDCAFTTKEIASPPNRLCMLLKVEFATDSAKIAPIYYAEINRVGDYMQKYPTTTATIEGHTDNVGGLEHNMKLSQQRAESVVNYLVEKYGIDRSRLTAKGYGSTRRIAYNNTPEGRQKNRRINAVIDCAIEK